MPETAAVALQSVKARTHSPLALWHLLSLDAPTVATLWLTFGAHATHTALPPLLAPAMFLAVWLIYAADRIFDSARLADPTRPLNPTPLEPRHHFHQQHRTPFVAAMAAAGILLALLLAETRLPPFYFPLAAAFVLWFLAVHLPRVPASARLPKEPATGLLFSAAIFAPELPHHLPAALAFALLCTLNCAWITRWETPQPTHPLTRALVRWLPGLTAALALVVCFRSPLAAAIALSAAALLALNHFRHSLHPTTLRAAADLALLTPLLLLFAALPFGSR